MDIASRPSDPLNQQTADAATPPHDPATVRREDYRPPDWLVPEVSLLFALGLDETVSLIKNNIDHETDATFGSHENYLVTRQFPFSRRGVPGCFRRRGPFRQGALDDELYILHGHIQNGGNLPCGHF